MIETKFKETEVGRVPADWEVKTLGEISKDTAYGVAAEATTYDGKNRYIRITDISDENGSFQPNPLTSPSFFNDEHIVKENDLLVARTGATVGKTYIYNHSDGKLVYAGFLIKTNICKADSKYVFYYTQTYPYKLWVISESMRSGQPGLNAEQLKTLNIPLPPLPEQRRIATALSDIDSLISSLDELLEKKRNIKQGTMQQLLTGKTRLKGFSEPWGEKKLGEGLTFQCGAPFSSVYFNTKSKGLRLIKNRDLKSDDQVFYYSGEYSDEYLVKNGDILVGMDGDFLPCKWMKGSALLNQRVGRIQSKIWDVSFLYYILIEPLKIKQYGTGATTVKHLSHGDIESMTLTIPSSLSEQHAIASILTSMDDEIAALEQKREKYVSLKQGMMQELLTGRIRLV